jgi:hypothetical protein
LPAQPLFKVLKELLEIVSRIGNVPVFPCAGDGRGRGRRLFLAQGLGNDPAHNGDDPDDHIHVERG